MPPHGSNSQGGRRGGGFSSGRGGGRRGGRGGGRGEQRWWDPVWRAERLRQQQAEVLTHSLILAPMLIWYKSILKFDIGRFKSF